MTGLELSKGYYEEFGKPMLEKDFSDLLPYLAVGFVGSGSEHFGFDDEVSRDHDFEPGFCIFLPGEDVISRRQAFLLERAYARLPKEYAGYKRLPISPVGGDRNGVMRTAEFYEKAVGSPDGALSLRQWLTLPDHALFEVVDGEVYYDGYGEFTRIREKLSHIPQDVRLKRLAGNLLLMAQAGQYNFVRCLRHGEPEAAQLACHEFVTAAMKALFLLEGKTMPYYKWAFRALEQLAIGIYFIDPLREVLFADHRNDDTAREKYDNIEEVAARMIALLESRGLTKASCGDLEKHAYSVNDGIADGNVRNLHILAAV